MSDGVETEIRAEEWSGEMGRNWLANLQRFESMIAPLGAAFITQAEFRPGERVIDVGCGGGGTSIAIGRAVSPGGHVTGLDISQDLIWACGARASQGTQSDVRFVCADAATVTVTGGPFDRLFSRFGSMFFADAKAGFRNLRRMVRDGGRIDLAVWAGPQDNPWMQVMMGALQPYVAPPETPADPRAPGPFVFADTDYLKEVLHDAGFRDVHVDACMRDMPIGGAGAGPEEAADFVLSAMHLGGQIPEDQRAAAHEALTAAFAPHHVAGKGVLLPGQALFVRATAAAS
ncbi:class I SAM-dependent methyltransferase [Sphingobium lignivorans]|uniref:SAM-dependent methyltransferase n=1 Tax=Sphingobium lignivorans TaxID=2735886 RepID=A0ABR6NJ96_9SPHN|nr:class I SAM-dependent methyltransferase [Sphingobium lignivorans]MBB5987357.1 SAM-dependent methyltransferase [Sphingobium lignivorans]